jgi:cyclic pyranopterin phosphate synthase
MGGDGDTARIVEVGAKEVTDREAVAECVVSLTPEACAQLVADAQGNPLEAARIAGIMGEAHARPAPVLSPHRRHGCRGPGRARREAGKIVVRATVRARDRTGVEMEALTAAAVAALSLYDTAKAYDRAARIDGLRLLEKRGGKSGHYVADA